MPTPMAKAVNKSMMASPRALSLAFLTSG
jgi:hypothetical protein